jgi:hypothetical protein
VYGDGGREDKSGFFAGGCCVTIWDWVNVLDPSFRAFLLWIGECWVMRMGIYNQYIQYNSI